MMEQVSAVVEENTASTEEMATSSDVVKMAIETIAGVSEENAAMVEESTAASHALTHEAEILTQLVAKFEIGAPHPATTTTKSAPAKREPVAAPASPSAKPTPTR